MVRWITAAIAMFLLSSSAWATDDFSPALAAADRFRDGSGDFAVQFDASRFTVAAGTEQAISQAELARLQATTLQKGARGGQVARVQEALGEQGYLKDKLDALFDEETERAVKEFQKAHGLGADGKVGPTTWKALDLEGALVPEWMRSPEEFSTADRSTIRYRVSAQLHLIETESRSGKSSWTKIVLAEVAHYDLDAWPAFVIQLTQHGLAGYKRVSIGRTSQISFAFRPTPERRRALTGDTLNISDEALDALRMAREYPARKSGSGRFVVLVHEPHDDVNGHYRLIQGLDALLRANPDKMFRFLVEGDLPDNVKGDPPGTRDRDIPLAPLASILAKDAPGRARQVHYLVRNYLVDSPLAYRLLYGDVPSWATDDPISLEKSPRTTLDATLNRDFASREEEQVAFEAAEKTEAEIIRLGKIRSGVMVQQIQSHFSSAESMRVPIAFIGSGHTREMIGKLSPGVGYVVLEPRGWAPAGANWERFNDAVHNYSTVVEALKKQTRKIRVFPPPSTIPALGEIVGKVATRDASRPAPAGPIDATAWASVRNAIDQNAFFDNAQISVAGGDGSPPTGVKGAFASFKEDDRGGKLLLLPGKKEGWNAAALTGWKDRDRLSYLQHVVLPPGGSDFSAPIFLGFLDRDERGQSAAFRQDPTSGRMFGYVYVAEERTFYFIDAADENAVRDALAAPQSGNLRERHYLFSEVLRALTP